jgi:acyl-CoA dehydrogenase
MIQTGAERDGDEWRIDGHKWWVTQGGDADVLLVFAKSDAGAQPYKGISCFIVPADADGVTVERDIAHMSDHVAGEPVHSEVTFDNVRIPDENVLGKVHDGFGFFQQGVEHSRVWLGVHKIGMADRALDIAKAYADEREAFGERLADKQAFRYDVAEAETDLYTLRLMARDVTRKITDGQDCRTEVAMFKYYCANTAQNIIDEAVQLCGANGIGEDLPLSNFYTNVRAYRIYDGPDAVHKKVIAREAFDDEQIDESEVEQISRFGHPNTWPSE